jgi:hypothetical protein
MLAEKWDQPIQLTEGVASVPTMLAQEEMGFLRWYMRDIYTGRGEAVEMGSYVGGSTAASLSGLVENPHPAAQQRILQVYDLFHWQPFELEYYRQRWPQDTAAADYQVGDDFEPLFLKHVTPWKSRVQTHSGDILRHFWNGNSIEYLFVDVMKSWQIAQHVTREFFPSLEPNLSMVVQQDFKHWYTFWIHLLMYRLRDYLEPQYSVVNAGNVGSVSFACVQRMSRAVCDHACDFWSFLPSEINGAFEYSMDIIGPDDPARSEVEAAWLRTYLYFIQGIGGEHIHSALTAPWADPITQEIQQTFSSEGVMMRVQR